MVDFYPGFSNFCTETITSGNKAEQLALSQCRLAVYSSDWAAATTLQYYNVAPSKIKVVPFGANIECNRTLTDTNNIIENKNFDVCNLLFLGVDWHRKGGSRALKVASLLNQRGVKTELHIVGCNPPNNLPGFVKCHGFVSKKTKQGLRYLEKLLSKSHFLILLSIAKCVAVVFAEASSFGL